MKSIYLKPEEIREAFISTQADWGIDSLIEFTTRKSADNAVRVIIEWLKDNCYVRGDTGNRVITPKKWQELKKLQSSEQ